MDKAINEYGRELENRKGIGLFYYAGHGIQSQGENYLIPVNSYIERETELKHKSVSVSRILDEMSYANNGMNIVILDACRNNPLIRSFRNSSRGLSRVSNTPKGTILTYSTDPGNIALDGDGRNSPFAKSLIIEMQKPNQQIEQAFKNVRKELNKLTKGKQTPFTTSSLSGDFYFKKIEKQEVKIKKSTPFTKIKIEAKESKPYFGQYVTACGTVVQVKKMSKMTYLNIDYRYPNQSLTLLVWDTNINTFNKKFGNLTSLVNKRVCAIGDITKYKGKLQIHVDNSDLLRLMYF